MSTPIAGRPSGNGVVKPLTPRRVAICVPSGDIVLADFAMCLAALTYASGLPLALINTKGSLVQTNRNNAVVQAKQLGVDYILFIDSDMTFPMTALKRLLAHGKDIVAATYVQRTPPHRILHQTIDGQEIRTTGGLVEVAGLPTGFMLIRAEVFDKIEWPCFRTPVISDPETGVPSTQSEDYYFCQEARKAGYKIWLDVDLTFEMGHVGQFTYKVPNAAADAPMVASA